MPLYLQTWKTSCRDLRDLGILIVTGGGLSIADIPPICLIEVCVIMITIIGLAPRYWAVGLI